MTLLVINSTYLSGTHCLHLQGSPRRICCRKETVSLYTDGAVYAIFIASQNKWCYGMGRPQANTPVKRTIK
jgi:hypothetical protein